MCENFNLFVEHLWMLRHFRFWITTFKIKKDFKKPYTKVPFGRIIFGGYFLLPKEAFTEKIKSKTDVLASPSQVRKTIRIPK